MTTVTGHIVHWITSNKLLLIWAKYKNHSFNSTCLFHWWLVINNYQSYSQLNSNWPSINSQSHTVFDFTCNDINDVRTQGTNHITLNFKIHHLLFLKRYFNTRVEQYFPGLVLFHVKSLDGRRCYRHMTSDITYHY